MKKTPARIVLAVSALMAGLLASVATQPATATTGDGGSFVPVAAAHIADTSTGVGFSSAGAFGAGTTRSLKVLGVGGVPTSNVSAVVIDLAGNSTADSRQYVWPSDEERHLAALSLGPNQGWDSTTIVVRPGDDGRINIYNEAGTTSINVDVQGYFTKVSTSSSTGGFVPAGPTRVVDTTKAQGISSSLAGGTTYSMQIGGMNDIPTDAIGVYANVRALNAPGSGGIRIVPSNQTPGQSTPTLVNYDSGRAYDSGAALKLGPDGKINIYSSVGISKVDLIIDIQGYFTAGSDGSGFHPLSNTRVYDSSRAGALGPGEERTIAINTGGMPTDGAADAAALAITAKDWTSSGQVSVTSSDSTSDNGTSSIAYSGTYSGVELQSTSFVRLGDEGEVTVRNRGSGSVSILINTQGWFGDAGTFTELSGGTIYDSTADPDGKLAGGASREIDVLGKGGVPDDGVVYAVGIDATVANWSQSGALDVYNSDESDPGLATASFSGSSQNAASGVSYVTVSGAGSVIIKNTSSAPIDVKIAALGWYDDQDEGGTDANPQARLLMPQTIASGQAQTTFSPAMMTLDSLRGGTDRVTVVEAGDENLGYYTFEVKRANGTRLTTPPTLSVTGNTITVAARGEVADYPLSVEPTYVDFETADSPESENPPRTCPVGRVCASEAPGVNVRTYYKIINHTKKTSQPRKKWKYKYGACYREQTGNCTVTKGGSTAYTYGTAFGLSGKWVAGNLNFTYAKTNIDTQGCGPDRIKGGYYLIARPIGTDHRYRIRETKYVYSEKTVKTSGWKKTYHPYKDTVSCAIVKAK